MNKVFWLIPAAMLTGGFISATSYLLIYAGSDPHNGVPGMVVWQTIGGGTLGALFGTIASTVSWFVLQGGKPVPIAATAAFLAVTMSWATLLFASSSTGVGFPLSEIIIAALSASAAAGFILVIARSSNRRDGHKTL